MFYKLGMLWLPPDLLCSNDQSTVCEYRHPWHWRSKTFLKTALFIVFSCKARALISFKKKKSPLYGVLICFLLLWETPWTKGAWRERALFGLQFFGFQLLLQCISDGRQGWSQSRDHGGTLLTGLLKDQIQLPFFQDHMWGTHPEWTPSQHTHLSLTKKMPNKFAYRPI